MIGVLIISHEDLGHSLIRCVTHVLGARPPKFEALAVESHDDAFNLLPQAKALAASLDDGEGVLVVSDIYGATPCNVANRLPKLGVRMHCVSGLNLPMLLRVLNYPEQSLDDLAQTAATGGRGGIFVDTP